MATLPTCSTGLSIRDRPVRLEEISGLPLHTVIIFAILALIGDVQYQCIMQKKSLFEDHRNVMVAILVTLSCYALGCMAEYKLASHRTNDLKLRIVKRFTPLFGFLVVVLLLTILLPFLGIAAIILWALFILEASIKTVEETPQWLRLAILSIKDAIIKYSNSAGGSGSDIMSEENRPAGGEGNESSNV